MVVRQALPEGKGEPGRQRMIVQRPGLCPVIEKLRRTEHPAQDDAESFLEAASFGECRHREGCPLFGFAVLERSSEGSRTNSTDNIRHPGEGFIREDGFVSSAVSHPEVDLSEQVPGSLRRPLVLERSFQGESANRESFAGIVSGTKGPKRTPVR